MFFNSLSFAIFLPIVFLLYWFVFNKNKTTQNAVLIVASYYFYSCWDWRFLFLLVFSTLLDYFSAIMMETSTTDKKRKFWLWLTIGINLGFLEIFKYYDFFAQSFTDLLHGFGFQTNPVLLKLILPVGISFYTFHGLSYVIDIYYKRITAERNFIDYSLFVSYFPLLVAGPIERATHLLPQIKKQRTFDYTKAVDGLRQILWGLFKKVVIADNCAELANQIFNNPADLPGSVLVLGALLFTFQIYGDFSGYSDIALGTARLFGIELLRNFAFPYFSRDIAEFWRRWHISLSSWFKDYLYIPLGGSKGGNGMRIRNTFIIFIVSGFWHGANWTFIVWGALNALFIMPSIIMKTNRNNLEIVAQGKLLPTLKELFQMVITFGLTVFAWIFFRAEDINHAISYISGIFSKSLFSLPLGNSILNGGINVYVLLGLIFFFILIEWLGREGNFALQNINKIKLRFLRWFFYLFLIIIILFYSGSQQEFIYFQF